ncbi:MAG: EAL domain-containing protein [Candidatus Thiodiazotropha sp. (ex Dulcina madagascariensis)]|nr:EAL domain-containing protein [Candidatus Thiodiazotropha sp. (ex Dulcina madagascariensis)]MCU7926295.1 EAL domain-containing protein [Candidatus Thiodiazotropha sp. (ex Dulcina madagascariensis)]
MASEGPLEIRDATASSRPSLTRLTRSIHLSSLKPVTTAGAVDTLHQKTRHDERRLHTQLLVAVFVWTLLVASILLWSQRSVDSEMLGLARLEAIANFNKDQAFRVWATTHGGVYVPISERTPPSPYLSHIPERDLVTPSGRRLTLMNPAYMLRQMMDDYNELYGVKGRITSLKPLNPRNAPDDWEREALVAFIRGEKERFEVTEIGGQAFLRLIRPMPTQEGCLKCHLHQGYKVGDIRGGVGVSVPLAGYLAVGAKRKQSLWAGLSMVWAVGIGGIWLVGKRGRQRILERKGYEGRIWRQANFDALTGLSNRNLFMDRLDRALAYAHRQEHRLALLFIDLDRFKDVNDTLGHTIGDRLLQEAGQRLKACVREMDTVSRLGGDEFTVILPDIAEEISTTLVATNILAILSQPFELDGQEVHLSASIGITIFPQDGEDPGMLLQNADTAMYRAKAEGRNIYRYFTWEMNRAAEGRLFLESALRRALKREEFELHYQPILNASGDSLVGAEALIRWESPERGLMGPDEFIPLAEECGLILPLGEWVLQRAAADLAKWDRAGLALSSLSVNVSTLQFRMKEFTNVILELLQSQIHLRSRLFLEITESVFMDERGEPDKCLDRLREQSIRIAIDDFGTGYSSLSYLKRFPVDSIKIDRSFVRDVTDDPENAALCEAIIAMAHHLGIKVVAEGVETVQQWQFLHDGGCDFVQGYLFGRPMPFDAFPAFLKQHLPMEAPVA